MDSPSIVHRGKKDKDKEDKELEDQNVGSSQQQQQKDGKKKNKSILDSLNQVFEIERIRNKFISHEFHKLDRTRSRINPPRNTSDTESESDSEVFLSPKPIPSHTRKLPPTATTAATIPTTTSTSSTPSNSSAHSSVPSTPSSNSSPILGSSTSTTSSPIKTPSQTPNGLFALRPSLLSSESSDISYRGLINLLVLLLIFISFRLVILNHLQYGIRIDLSLLTVSEHYRWPGLIIGLTINFFILAAYYIELASAKRLFSEKFCYLLRVLNCTSCIVIPSVSILVFKPNPASGIIVMLMVCIYSMKLISYAYENSKQRKFHPDNSKLVWNSSETAIYPNNLSLKSMYWYMLVPSLVYQLSYPRSPRIRKGYLLRRIFEALFLSLLIFWLVEQYMVPLVENSLKPMENYDLVRIIERVMKLSLPNLYVWLLGFYVFFHLYLNIVAEITRFGDREFYRDWWNSTGLDYFWRTWNMPVHHWMVVLIYTPMRRRKWSKNWGYFMCFFVSAVFHELVISIPFQTIKLWGFLGIMSQMVLIAMTKGSLNGQNIGNVIFWLTIVLGQPLIVLLYYRNFIQENPSLYPNLASQHSSEGFKL